MNLTWTDFGQALAQFPALKAEQLKGLGTSKLVTKQGKPTQRKATQPFESIPLMLVYTVKDSRPIKWSSGASVIASLNCAD